MRWVVCLSVICAVCITAQAQISKPADAPQPLAPEVSAQRFTLTPGFQIQLVASEPLIREPSGVCWDESGQLYVCELHGYNLEGQYDIEELNKKGKLDRIVRRVQAADRHKKAAEAETYGTIKRLFDTDGDGRMDQATVWADRLPPCFGICPARGGLIVACQTEILFLADRDQDGKAEHREVLFAGFAKGPLERSVNCPQWGPDDWIYFGSGAGGGKIHGPHLEHPVQLPRTNFRIRADGSAIEPVVGVTGTMGHTFTRAGDRFVISTGSPGIFVAPLPWNDLARNPHVAAPRLERATTSDQRAWPTSQPHPWRTRRAEDPGFSKYYRDRYGAAESTPNGYFTSACSPLVYRDTALPGLDGHLLACEPAQNFVYRGIISRDGLALRVNRPEANRRREFLASSDPWFHAISLAHAPDGTLFVVDFYREIIEDYSAIPRYLQQQYGLVAGENHGRIWRLTHERITANPQPRQDHLTRSDLSQLDGKQLAAELASPRFWRRQTARRLLVEKQLTHAAADIRKHVAASQHPEAVLNALATLQGLNSLQPADVIASLAHEHASVRRRAVALARPWINDELCAPVLRLAKDPAITVQLQVALSLGECDDPRAIPNLAFLSRKLGADPWMAAAILSSVPDRGGALLAELLTRPDEIEHAEAMLAPLCTFIANRGNAKDLSQAVVHIQNVGRPWVQAQCLRALSATDHGRSAEFTDRAREAVARLTRNEDAEVRKQALAVTNRFKLETPLERQQRLAEARRAVTDVQLDTDQRLQAVTQLFDDTTDDATQALLSALTSGAPRLQQAVLDAVCSQEERFLALLNAIAAGKVPAGSLSAVQRARLIDSKQPHVAERAKQLLKPPPVDQTRLQAYSQALAQQRDPLRGEQVFRRACAKCHQAHGLGYDVGPDLSAEFLRAEATIIHDVLAPSDKISPEFATYSIRTASGRVVSGLLAAETPTSITLRQEEGKQEVVLRRDVEQMKAMSVSLMPEDLTKSVSPRDLADALAWLRRPPTRLTLVDDNQELIGQLDQGAGTARFVTDRPHHGNICLQVTPPQRYSSSIPGWQFRIREHPQAGEYRYMRFAWRSAGGHGVMIELADNGKWPPAKSATRRYHAGRNTTGWGSVSVADEVPRDWIVVTRDLWSEFGDFTLTGIAPTAMGGAALFDQVELLQSVDDPSAARRTMISSIGSERATSGNGNKIVTYGGRTHVVWQDSNDEGYFARIKSYNQRSKKWSDTYTLGKGRDNHSRPTITVDSQGYLHAIIGGHHTGLQYRRSVRPGDASAWSETETFGKTTYPILMCGPDDTLLITGRHDSQWKGMDFYRKRPGQKWESLGLLVAKQPRYRFYAAYHNAMAWGPDHDTLHMSVGFFMGDAVRQGEHQRDPQGLHQAVGYMRSQDMGRTWTRADGTAIKLPATTDTIDLIAEGTRARDAVDQPKPGIRHCGMAVDSNNRPHIVYVRHTPEPGQVFLVTPDDAAHWRQLPLQQAVNRHWPNRAVIDCSVSITRDDVLCLMLTLAPRKHPAANWSPGVFGRPAFWLREHPNIQQLVWLESRDGGNSFVTREVIRHQPDRGTLLPTLERPTGFHGVDRGQRPPFLYFEGLSRYRKPGELIQNKVFFVEPLLSK